MTMHFPEDTDGATLKRLALSGSDLASAMEIDFFAILPDGASAQAFAATARDYGFSIDLPQSSWEGEILCICRKTMIPDHLDLVASQKLLEHLTEPYGGHAEGWGTSGNRP